MNVSDDDSYLGSEADSLDSQYSDSAFSGTNLGSDLSDLGLDGSSTRQGGFLAERQHVAVFQLAETIFALDTTYVGEVLVLDRITEVPLTPSCILGVRNLRGAALPIVDLAEVLALPGRRKTWKMDEGTKAMVLTLPKDLLIAVPIEQMLAVVPWHESDLRDSEVLDEHAAILGILDLSKRGGPVAALLDGLELTRGLEALRPQTA